MRDCEARNLSSASLGKYRLLTDELKKEFDTASVLANRYKDEVKSAPNLESRIGQLEAESSTKNREIAKLKELLGAATNEDEARALMTKYDRAWYAAVVGWVVGLGATLGVLALLGQPRGSSEPPSETDVQPSPTHRIT